MRASGHLVGGVTSFHRRQLPNSRFWIALSPLGSIDQARDVLFGPTLPEMTPHLLWCQICCQRAPYCIDSSIYGSGSARRDDPTRKCPGINAARSSGSSLIGRSGRELRYFHLREERRHFFIDESVISDDMCQMVFDWLDGCFPQSSKVWCCRLIESPVNLFLCQDPSNVSRQWCPSETYS